MNSQFVFVELYLFSKMYHYSSISDIFSFQSTVAIRKLAWLHNVETLGGEAREKWITRDSESCKSVLWVNELYLRLLSIILIYIESTVRISEKAKAEQTVPYLCLNMWKKVIMNYWKPADTID